MLDVSRTKLFVFGTVGTSILKRLLHRSSFAVLLSLLAPGLGHIFWREYLFGVFIFLVMSVASVLVFFSFLVELPLLLKWGLFGLPVLFYLFTFVDLKRSIRRNKATPLPGAKIAPVFLLSAILVNLCLPLSPTNLALRNHPTLSTIHAETFKPLFNKGELCLVDRLAYRVNLFFLDKPLFYGRPNRWDLISFTDEGETDQLGLVVGFGGEEVSYTGGVLLVDSLANSDQSWVPAPDGEIPLTRVEAGGILVATLEKGTLVGTRQILDRNIVGKVHPLF